MDRDKRFLTADGFPIVDGETLWNYYDLVRVTPDFDRSRVESEYWDGWFTCLDETGGKYLVNGERLSMYHPFTRERARPKD